MKIINKVSLVVTLVYFSFCNGHKENNNQQNALAIATGTQQGGSSAIINDRLEVVTIKDKDGYPKKAERYIYMGKDTITDENGKLKISTNQIGKVSLVSKETTIQGERKSKHDKLEVTQQENGYAFTDGSITLFHPVKDGKFTLLTKCEYGVGTALTCAGKGSKTKFHAAYHDYLPTTGNETQDIYAIGRGRVVKIAKTYIRDGENDGYGYYIIIEHKLQNNSDCSIEGGCIWSFYAHLSEISSDIQEGQEVSPETVIAKMGGTGGWDNHLHLEILTFNKETHLTTDRSNKYSFGYTEGDPYQYGYLGPKHRTLLNRTLEIKDITVNKDFYNTGERVFLTWKGCRPDFNDTTVISVKDDLLPTPSSDLNGTHTTYRILTSNGQETENDCQGIFTFPSNLDCTKGCRFYVKAIDQSGKEAFAASKIILGGTSLSECGREPSRPDCIAIKNFKYPSSDLVLYLNEPMTAVIPTMEGGVATEFGTNPLMPKGITVDKKVGIIYGTPTEEKGKAGYLIEAKNQKEKATTQLSITIISRIAPPPTCPSGQKLVNGKCQLDCLASQHIEGGACKDNTIVCPLTNGIGAQTWNGSNYSICTPTSCNAGHHVENNLCVKDKVACSSSQHEENGICIDNKRTCTFSNATSAEQLWSGGVWGSCYPIACATNYIKQDNSCLPQICKPYDWYSETCGIVNGSGSRNKQCNNDGLSYLAPTTCTVTSCNSGYINQNNVCTKQLACEPNTSQTQSCPKNNGTGTQARKCFSDGSGYEIWGECFVATCNSGFTNVANNCARISTGANVTVYESATSQNAGTLSGTSSISIFQVKFQVSKTGGTKCAGKMSMYKSTSCSASSTDPANWGNLAGETTYLAGDNPTVGISINSNNLQKICYRVKMKADLTSTCQGSTSWSYEVIPVIFEW